ncbi:DUF4190 domain-containing protein [Thalassiella azotivora]
MSDVNPNQPQAPQGATDPQAPPAGEQPPQAPQHGQAPQAGGQPPQAPQYGQAPPAPSYGQPAPYGAPPQEPPYGAQPAAPGPQYAPAATAVAGENPYATQPAGGYPPAQAGPGGPGGPGQGLAIGALVVGVLALLMCWIPFVNIASILLGLVGLVLGIVALAKVRKGTARGKGMALAGVVTSVLAVVASIAVLVVTVLFIQDVSNQVESQVGDLESLQDDLSELEDGLGSAQEVDPSDVVAVGETVSVGDYTVQVTRIQPAADAELAAVNDFNPEATGSYTVADLVLTYDGTDSGTPWIELSVDLAGTDGTAYSSHECMALTQAELLDVDTMTPGSTAQVQVCFDTPAEVVSGGTVQVDPMFAFDEGPAAWQVP